MNAMARLTALAIVGCVISTPLVAATYKWVDEKGAVHYSQTPPANRDYELLRNPPASKEEPTAPASDGAKAPPPAASPPAEDKEAREKACQEARTRLDALEKNPGRLVIKQTDGSMHKITEEERLGYIKETTARIDEMCK